MKFELYKLESVDGTKSWSICLEKNGEVSLYSFDGRCIWTNDVRYLPDYLISLPIANKGIHIRKMEW